MLYVGSINDKVYALDAFTGEKIWDFDTKGGVSTSPALDPDGTVYINTDGIRFYAL